MQRSDWIVAGSVAALLVVAALLPGARSAPSDAWLIDFYAPEGNGALRYNFSRPIAHAFVPDLPPVPAALVLRARSPQPLPARMLDLSLNDVPAASIALTDEPRTLRLLLPPARTFSTAGLLIKLETASATAPNDTRALGMLFESVVVQPLAAVPFTALALMLAACALLLGGGWLALRRSTFNVQRSSLALALLCSAWAATFSSYAIANHLLYRSNTYDLGYFDQALWLLGRGYTPYSSSMGLHVLGDHASLLLYPLALLYLVAPDVRALLVVQCVCIALGAVPLFLLARGRGHPVFGLLLVAAYLLHPATQNLALFDFHPDALASAALLWAAWAFERRRWVVLYLCCAAVLFAKENFALTVALFGMWIMAADWVNKRTSPLIPSERSSRRLAWMSMSPLPHGLIIAALSAAWLVFATRWLLPALNSQGQLLHLVVRYGQYGDSPLAIVRTLLLDPARLLAALINDESLRYLWQLAAPFGLLCLFGPRYAVLALPALLLNLLSATPVQRTIEFQYNALIVPVLALAALDGVMLLRRLPFPPVVHRLALVVLLIGLVYANLTFPLRVRVAATALQNPGDRPRYYDYAVSLVPFGASVSAYSMLQPHLTHRREAYMFPNPFRSAAFFNPAQMPYTASADYVLVDSKRLDNFFVPEQEQRGVLEALRGNGRYETVLDLDGVLVLRRK